MLCHVSANLAIVCSVTVDILLFYVVGGKIATYNITIYYYYYYYYYSACFNLFGTQI